LREHIFYYAAALLSLPKVSSFYFLHKSVYFLLQVKVVSVFALKTVAAAEEKVLQREQAQAPLSA